MLAGRFRGLVRRARRGCSSFSSGAQSPAPSIFNDVLGPVMRGPSSSHSAAALRIGLMARDLMNDEVPATFTVEYDPNGSLVTTHDGQGSDMGLFGGLMGWDADDDRLLTYKEEEKRTPMTTEVKYVDYNAPHPNTYRMTLVSEKGEKIKADAISTGGGMLEYLSVEGFPISMLGGRYETLAFLSSPEAVSTVADWLQSSQSLPTNTRISTHLRDSNTNPGIQMTPGIVHVSSGHPLSTETISGLYEIPGVSRVRVVRPVLPVLDRGSEVPFLSAVEMIRYGQEKNLSLPELAAVYEAERGGISTEEVCTKMDQLVQIFRKCVREGRAGTQYQDRILPCQSIGLAKAMNSGLLIPGDVLNSAILYVSAIMEVKSSMGVIVAAPTAGSCGACPGTLLAVADTMGKCESDVTRAFLVAGMIGVLVQEHATFAAEMGGCMAECGAGSGMAAAAITSMCGGTTEQALGAASLAIQNSFGMTCDPVANRVEAPCLGKNVMAATNAISCANMSLAGYRQLIPLDEVLTAMKKVGEQIPHELRCTGKGGISATPTARAIEMRLAGENAGLRGTGGKVQC
ncbi:hypothetical protein AAMO2058_000004800 [Amorphochlora amoebiformis]